MAYDDITKELKKKNTLAQASQAIADYQPGNMPRLINDIGNADKSTPSSTPAHTNALQQQAMEEVRTGRPAQGSRAIQPTTGLPKASVLDMKLPGAENDARDGTFFGLDPVGAIRSGLKAATTQTTQDAAGNFEQIGFQGSGGQPVQRNTLPPTTQDAAGNFELVGFGYTEPETKPSTPRIETPTSKTTEVTQSPYSSSFQAGANPTALMVNGPEIGALINEQKQSIRNLTQGQLDLEKARANMVQNRGLFTPVEAGQGAQEKPWNFQEWAAEQNARDAFADQQRARQYGYNSVDEMNNAGRSNRGGGFMGLVNNLADRRRASIQRKQGFELDKQARSDAAALARTNVGEQGATLRTAMTNATTARGQDLNFQNSGLDRASREGMNERDNSTRMLMNDQDNAVRMYGHQSTAETAKARLGLDAAKQNYDNNMKLIDQITTHGRDKNNNPVMDENQRGLISAYMVQNGIDPRTASGEDVVAAAEMARLAQDEVVKANKYRFSKDVKPGLRPTDVVVGSNGESMISSGSGDLAAESAKTGLKQAKMAKELKLIEETLRKDPRGFSDTEIEAQKQKYLNGVK
jgi:hypothetical protein